MQEKIATYKDARAESERREEAARTLETEDAALLSQHQEITKRPYMEWVAQHPIEQRRKTLADELEAARKAVRDAHAAEIPAARALIDMLTTPVAGVGDPAGTGGPAGT